MSNCLFDIYHQAYITFSCLMRGEGGGGAALGSEDDEDQVSIKKNPSAGI